MGRISSDWRVASGKTSTVQFSICVGDLHAFRLLAASGLDSALDEFAAFKLLAALDEPDLALQIAIV
jgi:hypothetical protein